MNATNGWQAERNRRSSLPNRKASKHVLFSAVVKTDDDNTGYSLKDEASVNSGNSRPQTSPQTNGSDAHPAAWVFDTVPTLVPTPWELQRTSSKRWSWPVRGSAETASRRNQKPSLFDQLPITVRGLILYHVGNVYAKSTGGCADCLMQDLHTVSLVSKKWHDASTRYMYHTLWLSVNQQQRFQGRRRNKLRLLLRTLQSRPDLARSVRRIQAPHLQYLKQADRWQQDLVMDLAEIILVCPNLEYFDGMYPDFHSGQRPGDVIAALATREHLRQHMWFLDGGAVGQNALLTFFKCHEKWTNLETLVIQEKSPTLGPGSIYGILQRLPSLHHLALIGLSTSSFHDGTLQALTSLRSLRLEMLEGLTDSGLQQALPRLATSLQSLSLVDLDIKSLRTISCILSHFSRLTHLSLAQDNPPGLPLGADVNFATDTPLLASSTLTYLHWDILIPGSANQALESSIRAGGFPWLRTLRAPCDADGALQTLCRPLAKSRPRDADIRAYEHIESRGHYTRDLTHAKTAAQLRMRGSKAKATPGVKIVIQNDDDHDHDDNNDNDSGETHKVHFTTHVVGQYLGDVRSPLEYSLSPDFRGIRQTLGRLGHVVEGEVYECTSGRKGRRHVGARQRDVMGLFS
ncbi:hypothetical protein AAFC00_005914 [Neodothiora populina]|uniref:F-box domain-containing protein n=1 Tax=Neodothiora populina TaxID=2781224 RepID=A0ABR3P7M3_9PEZI